MRLNQAVMLMKSASVLLLAATVAATPLAQAEESTATAASATQALKAPVVEIEKASVPEIPTLNRKLALAVNPLDPMLTRTESYAAQMGPNSLSTSQQKYFYWVAQFIVNYNKNLSWDEVSTITSAIMQFSERYSVDFRLLTGIIAVESSFRKDAVSSSGAMGLGQLKADTAKWLGVADPFNPVDNVAGTARFLGWLLNKYNGSLDHAISAYYQGPGNVDRNGITPVCYPYLTKVNNALGRMATAYNTASR